MWNIFKVNKYFIPCSSVSIFNFEQLPSGYRCLLYTLELTLGTNTLEHKWSSLMNKTRDRNNAKQPHKLPYISLSSITCTINNFRTHPVGCTMYRFATSFWSNSLNDGISKLSWTYQEKGKYNMQYCTLCQCRIQKCFRDNVYLKLRIGWLRDTQKPPMVVAECPKLFDVQCIWGRIFVSLEKIFAFTCS